MNYDVLEQFLEYECDGFQRIEVIEKTKEYVVLRFYTWDANAFDVKIVNIGEVKLSADSS
ncbi:MAG: hypothetical protein DRP18_04370 [Candidatus Aenigmatarchaeota archaeon]|nr:MAG: hypothetical protein DRP18_04370 [Candidatus Aenigmarchaeota archaeon]